MLQRALAELRAQGCNPRLVPTTGPGAAGALAREAVERGADLILAAGGDGTINETIEGMVHSNAHLAVLPAGTANVFAMETRLGKGVEKAAQRISACRPHRIAVGRLTADAGRTSRHFFLMAGAGLDAHVVYYVNAAFKARAGKMAYWVAGWKLLGRELAEFDVRVNGREHLCSFALVSRVRNYGGDFEIAREVSLFDDAFEVVLFEGRRSTSYVKYFAGMVLGKLRGIKGVEVCRAKEVEIRCPEDRRVYVQVDGEFAGHLPAKLEIVPDALTILLPPEYFDRKRA